MFLCQYLYLAADPHLKIKYVDPGTLQMQKAFALKEFCDTFCDFSKQNVEYQLLPILESLCIRKSHPCEMSGAAKYVVIGATYDTIPQPLEC